MGDKNKSHVIPKDGQVMLAIIKEMGMTEYEPKTVTQLTDFVYNYVSTVLEEARYFANNSKKKFLDVEDVQVGLHIIGERTFIPAPLREISSEYVNTINSAPLPSLKPHCGLRLPRQGINLTNTNYTLIKKKPKNVDAVTRSGISVMKPKVTYIRRINPPVPAVSRQQSVIVPSMKLNFAPKIKIKAEVPQTNGTFKRKREYE